MQRIIDHSPVWKLSGEVIHGRGIGKLVGMPTANLQISYAVKLPPYGVYITKILYDGDSYYGITNIGTRPTIDADSEVSVETHILNFDREIYGEHLEIELFKKLRGIKKFSDFSSLLAQIQKDCAAVQAYFGLKRTCANLHMNWEKHQAKVDDRELSLSSKEFAVLYLLYSHPDISFTKAQIYEAVWHEPSIGCCHAVENTVFQIRKKCKKLSENTDFIKTLVGYGYKFCGYESS